MYDSFYHLAEKPFKINTDPRFLWCGEKHREALANLKYGLFDCNGFVVLTGDVGTGKTTLINALLESLDQNVIVAKLNHPSLDTDEFLALVAKTLDPNVAISGKSNLLLFFNEFLQRAYSDDKVVLLIIDEAHRLSTAVLEEIRLLSNIEQAGESLINIIFVGQDELKPMLASAECRALRQRITLFYEIQALTEEETVMYVRHRLSVTGQHNPLFSPEAFNRIYTYTKGNPRLINVLCDRALLTGYVKTAIEVDADIVAECARELDFDDRERPTRQVAALDKLVARQGEMFSALKTPLAAYAQKLRQAPARLRSIQQAAREGLQRRSRSFTKVAAAMAPLIGQNLSKALPTSLLAGISVFFLALTIGVFSAAIDKSDLHASKKSSEKEVPAQVKAAPPSHDKAERLSGVAYLERLLAPVFQPTRMISRFEDIYLSIQMPAVNAPTAVSKPPVTAPTPSRLELAAAALEQKDYQTVITLLKSWPAGEDDQHAAATRIYADALTARAGELMNTSPDEAEALLIKAVAAAPRKTDAYLQLGKIYTRSGEYARAVSVYEKIIDIEPEATGALFNLGYLYATTGKFETAERAFLRVVQLKPVYLDKALFNLAVVQQKLGKKKESIASLEEAVTFRPENEKALAYLSRLRGSAQPAATEPH